MTAPAPTRPRRWVGAPVVVFLLLAGFFGAVFAWAAPPFWGHDEITQYGRAYQVSQGGWLPQEIPEDRVEGMRSWGGEVPLEVWQVMGLAFEDYETDLPEPAPEVDNPTAYPRLLDAPLTGEKATVWFTNTSAYSPVPYLPQAASLALAEAVGGDTRALVYAPRIAGLLAYLAVGGLAVHALRGTRFAWVVVTVGLLPIAVFQAGTTTADTLTNALALLLSALLVKSLFLRRPLGAVETAALLGTMVALPLSKPTYVLLPLLALLVPAGVTALAGRGPWWRISSVAALAVGLGGFAAWTSVSGETTEGMGYMRSPEQYETVRPGDQMSGILADPLGFLYTFVESWAFRDLLWFDQFFGELGFSYVKVPGATQIFAILALVLAVLGAERLLARVLPTAATAAVVVLTTGMIFGTLYLSFSPVDFYIIDGVQGRYFVPLAVLGLAVLAQWVSVRLVVAPGPMEAG
ncbi:MAG TPA: DUF2142 domain-containing protein, partial [Actinomycetales bacterium]|nr:DUF2142 domain-containing protein [Actinomycetales bacterium]